MKRRDFLALIGSGALASLPAVPALAALPAEPCPTPAKPCFPEVEIIEILSNEPGYGSFSQAVTRTDGREVTYRFSWATGTGSLHYRWHYREHFGEDDPPWVKLEHPYHQMRLCKESVAADLPLPDRCPDFPRSAT
jgi:hypothetical protein